MNFQLFTLVKLDNSQIFNTPKPPKPARMKLRLDQKYEIVKRLKNGEQQTSLSDEYKVARSTIARISKLRNKIESFWLENEHNENTAKRKILRLKKDDALDSCLETWYLQNIHLGHTVSGKMIQEKALEFNTKLGGPKNFTASSGWLQRFKFRCGIKFQQVTEEKCSINSETAFEFKQNFSHAIKNDKLPLENIYNIEESILWWKNLPRSLEYERKAPKVTLVVCANASGSHKIPMMIIGRSKIPQSLNNADNLPVRYTSQENWWIDEIVFKEWLQEIFVPAVSRRQLEDGKRGVVVLLLDSGATRYVSDTNISLCGIQIKVVFLPMNLTSNVLPMNQGVIEKLKIAYKQNLVIKVLQRQKKGDTKNVQELLKNWNLKQSCFVLKKAWESISTVTLAQAWRSVCTDDMFSRRITTESEPDETPKLLSLLKKIPGYENCSEADANLWLSEDFNEDDDEIVEVVEEDESAATTKRKKDENSETEEVTEENECMTRMKRKRNENSNKEKDFNAKISAKINIVRTEDAIASLENVLKWIQQQDDYRVEDVSYIIKLRQKMYEEMKK